MKLTINPTTARPRGRLNIPIKDRKAPRNQTIQPTPGIQDKHREIRDNTKPAVPVPLDGAAWLMIVVELPCWLGMPLVFCATGEESICGFTKE